MYEYNLENHELVKEHLHFINATDRHLYKNTFSSFNQWLITLLKIEIWNLIIEKMKFSVLISIAFAFLIVSKIAVASSG